MTLSRIFAVLGALAISAGFATQASAEARFGRTKLCCSACQFSQWVPDRSGGGKFIWLHPPRCVGGTRVLISKQCPFGKYTCS